MKYKTAFRLALRGIGILVLAQQIPTCISSSGYTLSRLLDANQSRFLPTYTWTFQLGASAVGICIGLYLLLGGNWIINKIIPSNRPYCPECGYELTGLTGDITCPECGTKSPAILPRSIEGPSK